jgi:hypothetical protein
MTQEATVQYKTVDKGILSFNLSELAGERFKGP